MARIKGCQELRATLRSPAEKPNQVKRYFEICMIFFKVELVSFWHAILGSLEALQPAGHGRSLCEPLGTITTSSWYKIQSYLEVHESLPVLVFDEDSMIERVSACRDDHILL